MSDNSNVTCDVLVVGTGASGLTAAVTARKAGLDVLIVEKESCFGGTTATSGGTLWIPLNHHGIELGISDTEDAARRYLKQTLGNYFDEARVDAFLKYGKEMVRYLEQETEVKFVGARRPEYYSNLPDSALGRSIQTADYDVKSLGPAYRNLKRMLPQSLFMGIAIGSSIEMKKYLTATRSLKSLSFVASRMLLQAVDMVRYGRSSHLPRGAGLVARLARTAFNLNIPMWLSSPARRLVTTDGRVSGAEIETARGSIHVRVRRGVILACGGYPGDPVRRKATYSHVSAGGNHASPTPEGNTGDGVRIGEAAGGQFSASVFQPAAWVPVSIIPGGKGSGAVYPHFIERQKPGFIAVTPDGRRFVNEAGSYHDFVPAMVSACKNGAEVCAFLVCDHRAINRWGMGYVKPFPVPRAHHIRSGYLFRADSLADLARQTGIDPNGLVQTVEEFNRNARIGRDPVFKRGESAFDNYSGDPQQTPNPNLGPLERAPFYAMKIIPGEIATFAGLKTDAYARVLGENGSPVPGLYAVGNDMASVLGGAYPAAGTTLGPGMTFGYVAGRHIAGLLPALPV